MVDIIGEVVVKEGVFRVFEDYAESSEAVGVRTTNSTYC